MTIYMTSVGGHKKNTTFFTNQLLCAFYLIPREMDSDPFRLRGVWQPHMRGPVLEGEVGQDRSAALPGLRGDDDVYCCPRGEGITASGGRDNT